MAKRFLLALLLALGCASVSTAAENDEFCVRVRRVYVGTTSPFAASGDRGLRWDDAVIYVKAGKIYAVFPAAQLGEPVITPWIGGEERWVETEIDHQPARTLERRLTLPPEVPILDRRDLTAVPGFVLAQWEVGSGTRDDAVVGARFRALDAFDRYAEHRSLLAAGITTVFLHPGRGRLVTGEGAVVKLSGEPMSPVLRARAELCVELGERALRPPPRVKIPVPSSSDVPILPAERQRPSSRLGLVAELQARLQAALRYGADRERLGGEQRPELDPDKAALAAAFVDGRVRIDARRARDLRGVIALARDLGLEPVIAGATESRGLAKALGELGGSVIYEMPQRLQGNPLAYGENPDRLRPRLDTPARLVAAGVPLALVPAKGNQTRLRLLAALTVRGGLSQGKALEAITHGAARAIGVGERVGALVAGRDADFVLLSGEPLATSSEVVETWVDGRRAYRAPGRDALVIRAGTILTAAGEPILDGEVLIQDGTIAAVGSSVPHPRGARVIDAGPRGTVTPGFIDSVSHLYYEGEKGRARASVELHKTVASTGPAARRVARGGVTTVLTVPWQLDGGGSRITALKTFESKEPTDDLRRGLVLREAVGLSFDLSRSDPLVVSGALKGKLAAGKAYTAKWAKYRKALAAFKKKQAQAAAKLEAERKQRKLKPSEAPKKEEKKEEKKKEEKKPDKEEKTAPEPPKKIDPISGTWSFTLSGGPLPEPQEGILVLRLEDDKETINGLVRREGVPGEVPISGKIEGTTVTLTIEAPTPFGPPKITGEIVETDQMRGTVRIGPLSLVFEATRTEREVPEIKIQLKRRSKGGEPTPPPVDENLEPLRAVFEGRGAIAVKVASPAAALTVVKEMRRQKLPLVLVDFPGADQVADALKKAKVPVILRPEQIVRRDGELRSAAADLRARGVGVAFMSNGAEGSSELALRAVAGVGNGVAPGDALRALTIEAARAFKLDDRVGSLEVGKDGDVLVFDGPPFEATSRLRAVVVGGQSVPLEEN